LQEVLDDLAPAAPPAAAAVPEPSAGGHIFISYSHGDGDYAHRLKAALKGRGFTVWIDDRIDYGTQ
jgi:hypothetical protein